ncbi:MAG TPA: hypothetical protein VEV39_08795 [Gemmatimonadales bacterium]|nr:hypothetical protein [Gemmatimonadales bacterium]
MRRFATALTILAFNAAPLVAQEAGDTLPFRAHQWALLFASGLNFASVGALRFTAPNRAWFLDASLNLSHQHQTQQIAPDTTFGNASSGITINARVGRRFYQVVRKDIVSYETLGLTGAAGHSCSSVQGPFGPVGSTCGTQWSTGLFGEIGAQYLISSRLSVGGQVNASGFYSWSVGAGMHAWQASFNIGGTSFGAAIYF